ncbi:MAG: glycosyltransferase family 4 protein, partial [Mariniphaga sp.]|nr:glycosyltransferase family 4 protein [Mariniphaga sp.]
ELDKINPDIVHGQGSGFYGYYALRYSKNAIITLHGLAGKFFKAARLSDQISNIYNWIILLFLENYCIVKANNIISINPWVSELLKRKKYMGKIWNIPNAISEDYFQDIKINYKNKNLLFVGSILPRKGVLHIVKALKEITYYKLFLIYQYVDKKYLNEIKMFIEENNLKDRVTFVGSCDSKQIFEIMKKSCCLVLPSKMETAPMVISEAMAAGLPCIATNVGGIKYMIDDGLTGYVIPKNDAKIFSEKIQKLTKSPNQYLKMSTDCRNRAEKKFSIDIVSRKTYRLYKQILDIK